jgi:thiamine monophosphate synthase
MRLLLGGMLVQNAKNIITSGAGGDAVLSQSFEEPVE